MNPTNKRAFYDYIEAKLFDSSITEFQRNGIESIIDTFVNKIGLTDSSKLAYLLATSYHESGKQMHCHEDSEALVTDMLSGMITGKPLSKYLNQEKIDFVNSRRVFCKRDEHARTIAGYAYTFLNALNRDKA